MSKVAPSPVQARRSAWAQVLGVALLGAVVIGTVILLRKGEDPEVLSKRARAEFMERRFDRAEADLNRVLELRPPSADDRMLRAQLLIYKGRPDEALDDLANIPDGHPLAASAWLEAGQIELRRSRFVPAEAHFLKALRLNPKLVQARRELVYIYGMQLRRPELNATFRALSEVSTLTYAEVFLWCLTRGATWEPVEIVDNMQKCLKADPNDRWARLGLADALRDLARFDEADAALAPLPESDPMARATRVKIALERGDDQAADSILAGGPADNLDLALIRGRFALARGNGPEAVRQFRVAYDQAPNLREAVLGLGQALKTVGDMAAAAPLLEEGRKHERLGALVQRASVEKNRDDPALMRDLGEACASIGRFPEARAWYNLAIAHDVFDTKAQEGLARVNQREAEAKAKDAPAPK